MMKKFNLGELISKLQEDHRELDIGDNIAVYFKDNLLPIKINGIIVDKLKIFKGSFCVYDIYNENYAVNDYKLDIEMLSIEEYSDSPNSIYIDEKGNIDTDEYDNITIIEMGNTLVFQVEKNMLTHYKLKRRGV